MDLPSVCLGKVRPLKGGMRQECSGKQELRRPGLPTVTRQAQESEVWQGENSVFVPLLTETLRKC
jgi:hypothetical protein